MKNLLLLGLIGLLLNYNETPITGPKLPTCGNVTALKNSQDWAATSKATYVGADSVSIMIEECNGAQQKDKVEWLSLNQLPLKPGTYALNRTQWGKLHDTPQSAWFYTLIGNDMTGERYNLYTARNEKNEVTVDTYNPSTRELQGHMNATFLIDTGSYASAHTHPDTIRIREASFRVTVDAGK